MRIGTRIGEPLSSLVGVLARLGLMFPSFSQSQRQGSAVRASQILVAGLYSLTSSEAMIGSFGAFCQACVAFERLTEGSHHADCGQRPVRHASRTLASSSVRLQPPPPRSSRIWSFQASAPSYCATQTR